MADKKISHYLQLGRVKEVFVVLGFPLLGVLFSFPDLTGLFSWRVFVFTAASFFVVFFIWAFNGLCGLREDVKNLRFKYLSDGLHKDYLLLLLISLFCSLGLFLSLGSMFVWPLIFIFLLSFIYSYPAKGLKYRPWGGVVIHFVFEMVCFQMGWMLFKPISVYSVCISIFFAFLFSIGHMHHELIDYESDKNVGIRSSAVYFGKKKWAMIYHFSVFLCFLYWTILFGLKMIVWWEYLFFAAALFLQMMTFLFLRSKSLKDDSFFLVNRALYRVYYFLAGVCFLFFKIYV